MSDLCFGGSSSNSLQQCHASSGHLCLHFLLLISFSFFQQTFYFSSSGSVEFCYVCVLSETILLVAIIHTVSEACAQSERKTERSISSKQAFWSLGLFKSPDTTYCSFDFSRRFPNKEKKKRKRRRGRKKHPFPILVNGNFSLKAGRARRSRKKEEAANCLSYLSGC